MIVFLTEFGWLGHSKGITGGLTDIPTGVFELMVVVRAAILVLCIVAWVRRGEPAPSLAEPIFSPEPSQAREHVPV